MKKIIAISITAFAIVVVCFIVYALLLEGFFNKIERYDTFNSYQDCINQENESYGEIMREFFPSEEDLGNYEKLEIEKVIPSNIFRKLSKYNKVYALYVWYDDESYISQKESLQSNYVLEECVHSFYSYNEYLALDYVQLNNYVSLIIEGKEENRITYVFVECPNIDKFEERHFTKYQAWRVEVELHFLSFGEFYTYDETGSNYDL